MTGALPPGRYLTALNRVRIEAGGQTNAVLQRTRFFAEQAGTASVILTFDPFPEYAGVEVGLRERGKLHPRVSLVNIYDAHRDRVWDQPAASQERLPSLDGLRRTDECRADGSLWRSRYEDPVSLEPLWYDYVRPDGTVFARTAPLSMDEFPDKDDLVRVVDGSGVVRASYPSQRLFFASWVNQVAAGEETVFLFVESMMLPPHLTPALDPAIHQVAVMHMAHVYHPRNWNSPKHPPAERTLAHLEALDALVVLTERQRQDIELGYGARDNLFVLANPAEPATPPEPLPARDPFRIAMIARLERVKRVDHALRAFARVVEAEPRARLDVYGDGRLRVEHQRLLEELGLTAAVTLHGHRDDATDRLWEAGGLLMTSRSEGYPLAPLEAMMRGCPVVSYDIKYGPREQVEDGVTGYLVPPGDVERLADRVLDLIRGPQDAASMGARGREQRLADRASYVTHWAGVLESALAARSLRVHLAEVSLDVERVSRPFAVWSRAVGRLASSRADIELRARLTVDGTGPAGWLAEARLALDAVDGPSGTIVPIPLEVTADPSGDLLLAARASLRDLLGQMPGPSPSVSLRLSLTAHNARWETQLRRPPEQGPRRELTYLDDGLLRVRSRR